MAGEAGRGCAGKCKGIGLPQKGVEMPVSTRESLLTPKVVRRV